MGAGGLHVQRLSEMAEEGFPCPRTQAPNPRLCAHILSHTFKDFTHFIQLHLDTLPGEAGRPPALPRAARPRLAAQAAQQVVACPRRGAAGLLTNHTACTPQDNPNPPRFRHCRGPPSAA